MKESEILTVFVLTFYKDLNVILYFQLSVHLFRDEGVEKLDEMSVADAIFDFEDELTVADSFDSTDGPGKHSSLLYVEAFNPSHSAPAVLAYEENLLQLLDLKPPKQCSTRGCRSTVNFFTSYCGTALIFKWVRY